MVGAFSGPTAPRWRARSTIFSIGGRKIPVRAVDYSICSAHDRRSHGAPPPQPACAFAFRPARIALQNVHRLVLAARRGNVAARGAIRSVLNRPMRQAIGLDLPERRIGLSA